VVQPADGIVEWSVVQTEFPWPASASAVPPVGGSRRISEAIIGPAVGTAEFVGMPMEPNKPPRRVKIALLVIGTLLLPIGIFVCLDSIRISVQRKAVQAILDAGGTVGFERKLSGWRKWEKKVLVGPNVYREVSHEGSAWVRWYLGDDSYLEPTEVALYGEGCNDETMKHVACLASLKHLALWPWGTTPKDAMGGGVMEPGPRAGVTNDGLALLSSLRKLQTVSFHGNRITDAGLEYLKQLPELVRVQIDLDNGSMVSKEAYDSLKEGIQSRKVAKQGPVANGMQSLLEELGL
jgi:hypothetical protein